MAAEVGDQVQETTGSIGTGTITLVEKAGFVRFSDVFSTGDRVTYAIKNGNNWETGRGTIGATANTLERTTIYSTYVSGTYDNTSPIAITLSGTSTVGVVNPSTNIADPVVDTMTVNGLATVDSLIVDSTGTEALLVRKDADGGDVFTVDTTNNNVEVANEIILPVGGALPSLAWGTAGTGWYASNATTLRMYINNILQWLYINGLVRSAASDGVVLYTGSPSATTPIYTYNADLDTGDSKSGADELGTVVGGIRAVLYSEASSHVIVTHQGNYGLTANVGSSQGDGLIISSYNEWSTVGTAGDAATLPTSVASVSIYAINNGANAMDIFPNTGHDIDGAGANVAYSLAAGGRVMFHGSDSTNWNVF